MHRLGDVLDGLLALVEEFEFELVADLIAHHRRAGDAARPRQPLQPRRHVDAIAIEIVAIDDDVAEIDADAELDVPVLGNPGVALRHAALNFDRAARRIEHAAELDQEAVAHHLEDAPAMLGDGRIEELAAMLAKRAQRALFIGLHESAVANDIGRQDGRQPTLDLLLGHGCSRTCRRTFLHAIVANANARRRAAIGRHGMGSHSCRRRDFLSFTARLTILPKERSRDRRSARLALLCGSSAASLRQRPTRAGPSVPALIATRTAQPGSLSCLQSPKRQVSASATMSSNTSSMPAFTSVICSSLMPGVSTSQPPNGS